MSARKSTLPAVTRQMNRNKNNRVNVIKRISVFFDLNFSLYTRWVFIADNLKQLANYYRTYGIENDCRIIELADAFGFNPFIGFYNNKIKPTFLKFVCLEAIHKMNKEHEEHEYHGENHSFLETEKIIVACQKTHKDKNLQYLIPLRLQGVWFDEG